MRNWKKQALNFSYINYDSVIIVIYIQHFDLFISLPCRQWCICWMSFYLINLWQCSFPLTSVPVCPRLFICFGSGATQSLWRYSLIWIVSMTYPNLEKASRHQEVHDKYPDIKSPRFWSEHTSYTEVVIGGTCLGSFCQRCPVKYIYLLWTVISTLYWYIYIWHSVVFPFDGRCGNYTSPTMLVSNMWRECICKKKSNNSFDAVANKIS